MKVPRVYSIRKLKRILKKHGIIWVSSHCKGGHGGFVGKNSNGKIHKYPLPRAEYKKEITGTYLKALLRRFDLTEDILE